jgi:prephenate dehydratase
MPGQSLDELEEVLSHPIALMQCGEFIDKHKNLRAIEFDDTANAAKTIAEKHIMKAGAICGTYAAHLYGLEVLQEGIETNKHNFTRFLILDHDDKLMNGKEKNKSTVSFTVPHSPGALSKILTIISFYDINLTKIQSMPIIGKEWEYLFYVDLTYDDYDRYLQALEAFRPLTSSLQVLGDYAEGEQTI